MTIAEALKARVPRIRMGKWANPQAYLRLPLFENNKTGPWVELYDDVTQEKVLKVRPGSQKLCVFTDFGDEEFEVYTGPVSPFEQHAENYARVYQEE